MTAFPALLHIPTSKGETLGYLILCHVSEDNSRVSKGKSSSKNGFRCWKKGLTDLKRMQNKETREIPKFSNLILKWNFLDAASVIWVLLWGGGDYECQESFQACEPLRKYESVHPDLSHVSGLFRLFMMQKDICDQLNIWTAVCMREWYWSAWRLWVMFQLCDNAFSLLYGNHLMLAITQ